LLQDGVAYDGQTMKRVRTVMDETTLTRPGARLIDMHSGSAHTTGSVSVSQLAPADLKTNPAIPRLLWCNDGRQFSRRRERQLLSELFVPKLSQPNVPVRLRFACVVLHAAHAVHGLNDVW
jgi:hypothetical protein